MKTDDILQLTESDSSSVPAEGIDLNQVMQALARKWWIILGVTGLSMAAAGTKVISSTPESVGNVEILVRSGSAETDVIANIPETLSNGVPLKAITVTEDLLKILKSPKVLAPVVAKVQSTYPEICGIPEGLSGEATDLSDLCYQRLSSRLKVEAIDKDSAIVRVTFEDENPQAIEAVLTQLSQAYLDYSLETKQADIRRGIEFVVQKLPDLRQKVEVLQTQLQNLRQQNDVIDPASRATQLAEQITTFSQSQLEVEVQLSQAKAIANDLTQQLQSNEQASSLALSQNTRYQSLLNALLDLDSQIAEASTLYLDSSPDMQVLKEQRQNLLSLLASEGQQSQRELANQINELETQDQALKQTLQGLNADVGQLTGVTRSYDEIQRELAVASENLNQFIAKREALEIDAAQREIPWEIITPPTASRLAPTSLSQPLLLGGTLGLLLGTGIVLLVNSSSGVIYSEEELKRSTRLPILGSIPNYTMTDEFSSERMGERTGSASRQYASIGAERSGLGENGAGNSGGFGPNGNGTSPRPFSHAAAIPTYAQDPFVESFRSLYANLRLLGSTEPIRSVAISSVMAGEGKSTVALHLAEAAAAMGKRVLLIDGDLRNPQIHHYLELSNEKGLTNLFSGDSNPAIVQRFSPEPNLYVIAAGSASFDPTRLFSSRSMKRFAKKVEARFDLVIYDTPPLLGQSDAYLIADNTDGMLLVTRPGKLKQPLLDKAMEQLRIADIHMLGLVTREA
ncbi:MAG: capsular biosynthesis protein [Phormidesmis priestleyi]|uniref:Capsular biosynthesis protein n=1 Tax=Phormidesmis priestleyi TaxID=268141 RepID=A0A2W4WUP9_9CYAN|nr:MAG: capsular biosynthesis protein [Phormidesmis priestleyi]